MTKLRQHDFLWLPVWRQVSLEAGWKEDADPSLGGIYNGLMSSWSSLRNRQIPLAEYLVMHFFWTLVCHDCIDKHIHLSYHKKLWPNLWFAISIARSFNIRYGGMSVRYMYQYGRKCVYIYVYMLLFMSLYVCICVCMCRNLYSFLNLRVAMVLIKF